MSGVGYGILAMLGWGIGEFTAKKSVDAYGELRAYYYVQGIGLVLVIIIAALSGDLFLHELTGSLLLATLLIGVTYSYAYLNAFKAYRIGKLALVSPILCSYGMLSSVLAAIFLHQTLSVGQFFGIAAIIAGTILISIDFSELKNLKFSALPGVKEAIITFVFFGINSVILDQTVTETNVQLVNILNAAFSFLGIALMLKYFGHNEEVPTGKTNYSKHFLVATAILTVLANLLFILGYSVGDSILIAPIGASSGVITAILSFIFLKERITSIQSVGMIATFAGIILVSL